MKQRYQKRIGKVNPQVLKNLPGRYKKEGSSYIKDHLTLIISERKKSSRWKPKRFLLAVTPDGKRTYVSSLYVIGKGQFKLDYSGFNYIMEETSNYLLIASYFPTKGL